MKEVGYGFRRLISHWSGRCLQMASEADDDDDDEMLHDKH
jgi:hypothetical protein